MKFNQRNQDIQANNVCIRKGDTVVVIAGKDKGKKGKVLGVDAVANTCVVEGVNVVVKHAKARGADKKASRTKKPGFIHISNVQVLCKCGKAVRVSYKLNDKGVKQRICGKCGEVLDKKFVKTKEKEKPETAAGAETEEQKDVVKKPLQRREIKHTADVKITKPVGGKPSAGSTHRKIGS